MEKIDWKLIWIKVKAWFLALIANMWEDCLKEYFQKEIKETIVRASQSLAAFRHTKEYEQKRNDIVNKLFDKLNLPKWALPIKWVVKPILVNHIEKEIDKKLGLLEKLV